MKRSAAGADGRAVGRRTASLAALLLVPSLLAAPSSTRGGPSDACPGLRDSPVWVVDGDQADGRLLPAGVYLVRLETDGAARTVKVVLR